MYPYDIIPGVDLYAICFLFALCAALLAFRVIGDKVGLNAKVYNMCIISGIFAIVGGYFGSVLFQAFYDYLETGVFAPKSSGMTFYGGLIMGALTFIVVYFVVFALADKNNLRGKNFFFVSDIAAPAIALAHAIGRIGCLFAGCCHGRVTDAWYGIYTVNLDAKTVPIPLFESLYLFLLFGVLAWRVTHKKTYCLSLYLSAYAVWRFFIEYLRDDDRGSSPVSFLTPSQLTAIVLFAVAAALYFVMKYWWYKSHPVVPTEEKTDSENENEA